MSEILPETIKNTHNPLDIVTDKDGNVGLIQEVSLNDCQVTPKHQVSYSVTWLTGNNGIHAWFYHDDLKRHCNLFEKISEMACHPMGRNERHVKKLFKNWKGDKN